MNIKSNLVLGAKVVGQYRGIDITGVIGYVDKEDYGVTLDKPKIIEGVLRQKVLIYKVFWRRAAKPTWIKAA